MAPFRVHRHVAPAGGTVVSLLGPCCLKSDWGQIPMKAGNLVLHVAKPLTELTLKEIPIFKETLGLCKEMFPLAEDIFAAYAQLLFITISSI